MKNFAELLICAGLILFWLQSVNRDDNGKRDKKGLFRKKLGVLSRDRVKNMFCRGTQRFP